MIVGLYTSASGMLAQASRHEAIANNLANVSTTGFKRDVTLVRQQPVQLLNRISDNIFGIDGHLADLAPVVGSRGEGAIIDAIQPNMTQGSLTPTGNDTDFSITGEGFFMVDTARGRRYTRQGDFALDGRGRLVTQAGDPVLDSTGAQIVPGNKRLEVDASGAILLDGTEVGRLAVVKPDAPDMIIKEGEGLWAPVPGARFSASEVQVTQRHLERSNVNPVLEMAEMLSALRSYEANQRAVVAQDETLNTLISQVGRFG
jgi:flagellar basal-body rod protein FlgG